ncbi:MAG: 50S ribosomal protein L4 [Candidatus Daviesbacteria bacterium]|nr:MAG: 50S ribosomal protein L4 [Candidatus Daviesbacteria bacterium]
MPRVKKTSVQNKKPTKIATSRRGGTRNDKMSIPVYSLAGLASGRLVLPKEIFGGKINEKLLAQAARVYSFNQKIILASTKTRGQVKGTTAKAWSQKGTGRARHGAKTAPIFVGGGVVFGPNVRKVNLELPKKMKKAALLSALSAKAKDQEVMGLTGLEKASGKTKQLAKLLGKIKVGSALIVTSEKLNNVVRATNNLPKINVLPANQLNAYEILKHQILLIEKNALGKLGGK